MNNFVFFREPEECELHFTLETSNSPGSSLSTTPTPVTGMLAIEGSELITIKAEKRLSYTSSNHEKDEIFSV